MSAASGPSETPQSPAEVALARTHGYELLSDLLLRGVTQDRLEAVLCITPLRQALAPVDAGSTATLEALAANHTQVLSMDVLPFQGAFLDPEGVVGGNETQRVLDSYARVGFVHDLTGPSPDHLGVELAALAFLTGAELDAHEDGLPRIAATMQRLQAELLDEHILRWIHPLTDALNRQGDPFYAALGALMLELLSDHRDALTTRDRRDALTARDHSFELPKQPDLANDPDADLGRIADLLLTPALSGIYLSRADLARLGRQHDLPRGFGNRRIVLTNLLRAASSYDAFDAVLGDIEALLQDTRPEPSTDVSRGVWSDRRRTSMRLLHDLRVTARQAHVG